ncbi:helix-turn-helix domain-containing protein [Bombella pollinis]|uniref:XRE family transcriptional regulator n=1 Tax=Bombella pollinis TaxID=2967337 RepID=A0ABT3WLW3_9PROT|nr:hypothetical protein [Bombella pollinis]MCX5620107.1 hypothetical protein [Bombella pollinis]
MGDNAFIDRISAYGRIRRMIKDKYGNQRNCACALGISESHLSDMLNARCELSAALLSAAGLVRRTVYQVLIQESHNDPAIDVPTLKRSSQ